MNNEDSVLSKIQTQNNTYKEEFDKSANAAWLLADYLIENPQNFQEYPWTLIPGPVRESIEYIVNRKKTDDAGSYHKPTHAVSLDMNMIAEEKNVMLQQEHEKLLVERTDFYKRIRQEIEKNSKP